MLVGLRQVMTPFVDKNDEDDRRNCAVFSDLSDVLVPQPCDAKHEWICKLDRGVAPSHGCSSHAATVWMYCSVCCTATSYPTMLSVAGHTLKNPYWYTERK